MVYNTINIIRIIRAFKQTNTNKEKKTDKNIHYFDDILKEWMSCDENWNFEEHNGRLSNV